MLSRSTKISGLKAFGRAFILSAALTGTLAGALGASTYTLSAMSEELWAADTEACVTVGETDGLRAVATKKAGPTLTK